MNPGKQKMLDNIATFGCQVTHVFDPKDEEPPFSYSVGIEQSCGAPELVVIGLKQQISHSIVNRYNSLVRNGTRFVDEEMVSGFIEGFDSQIRRVDPSHYDEYFGQAQWLYKGNAFSVLQLVYPTVEGVWPWDSEASPWFVARQPLLYKPAGQV